MKLRLGSRGSPLALAQSNWVMAELKKKNPSLETSLTVITTTGDKATDAPFQQAGGKGIFVREIEEALLAKTIDLAVHSLKDVPQTLPAGLTLGPSPLREDPRDAFLSRFGEQLNELPKRSTIGTSSPRRRAQILHRYKKRGYNLEQLRGNVETRIKKMQDGKYDAIVLAYAGLKRLGLDKDVAQVLELDEMPPAPCQGCLGLEYRDGDNATLELIKTIADRDATVTARAERAFLSGLGGNCLVPVGAYSKISGDKLIMKAILLEPDAATVAEAEQDGPIEHPELVGGQLAERLLYNGGSEIMMKAENAPS